MAAYAAQQVASQLSTSSRTSKQSIATLLTIGAAALWCLIAWWLADGLLTYQVQKQVNVEAGILERRTSTVADALALHLHQIHGIAKVVADDNLVRQALRQHDRSAVVASMPVDVRRQKWTRHPGFLPAHARLEELASTLHVDVIYIMDAAGDCILSSNTRRDDNFVGANYSSRDYFKQALAGNNGYQYAVGSISKIPGFYFSVPIQRDGRVIAVVAVKLNVADLSTWINQANAFLADKYGVVVLASDKALEMKAIAGGKLGSLTDVEQYARYRRNDFPPLQVLQWHAPALPQLKYFSTDGIPLLSLQRQVDADGTTLHVVKQMPTIVEFPRNRNLLSVVFALLGIAVIVGIRLWSLAVASRNALRNAQEEAWQRLSRLVNRVPGVVYQYQQFKDGRACFPYASDAIEEVYRVTPSAVREDASAVFAILHPEDREGVAQSIQYSAEHLSPWHHEYRVRFDDGSVRWLSGNALPMRLEDGSTLWHGFITDITEQKNLDLAFHTSLAELRLREAALEQISQGVTISGVDRKTTYVNKGFETITGYSRAEMLGRSSAMLQGVQTDPHLVQQMREALNAGQPFFGEILNYRKDGTPFWNELSIQPVRDEAGNLSQFVAVQRDVTERVRTREELKLKEFALNAAPSAIAITDIAGKLSWANEAFTTLTGYNLEEVRGEVVGEKVKSGLQSDDFYREMWDTILSKNIWHGELLNRRKNRDLYWEEMSIAPMVSEKGEVTHFVSVKQDISERKAMERDLRDAKDSMQGLLDAMAEGAFAVDAIGHCIFVNHAFMEILGYADEAEVIGRPMFQQLQNAGNVGGARAGDCQWMQAMVTHQPVNVEQTVFLRKGGATVQVEFWAHPIVKDSVVIGVIVTFIDITQRVLIKQEQTRMAGQLLQKNRLLQQYAEQVQEEEDIAREFIRQFSALDKISDPLAKFILRPATTFSGDIVAFARTLDDRLHLLLADSAGHGLTAALAVIPITQPFYQMTAKGFDIGSIAKEMNRRVRDYLPLPRYVACALISLDTQSETIQVWNGGCPSVLLLDESGRYIEHRFQSKHLPLGVLKPDVFNAQVEYLNYEGRACQLLSCSDGVTETMPRRVGYDGYDVLLKESRDIPSDNAMDRLVQVVERELLQKEQEDDVTLLLVDCPTKNTLQDSSLTSRIPEALLTEDIRTWELLEASEPVWEYRFTLTASQLKQLDVVPFLVGITSRIDGVATDSKIFMVLSELFNNALDHGLLKLDSRLKHLDDDMDAYFSERERRLAALERGKIEIRLDKFKTDSGHWVKIHFSDSGNGFDFPTVLDSTQPVGERVRHGRGILLLKEICNAVKYAGNGSQVTVYLELPA